MLTNPIFNYQILPARKKTFKMFFFLRALENLILIFIHILWQIPNEKRSPLVSPF